MVRVRVRVRVRVAHLHALRDAVLSRDAIAHLARVRVRVRGRGRGRRRAWVRVRGRLRVRVWLRVRGRLRVRVRVRGSRGVPARGRQAGCYYGPEALPLCKEESHLQVLSTPRWRGCRVRAGARGALCPRAAS